LGRPKLSEDKILLIQRRLIQGMSIRDIAEEAQVSERTVKSYKKNLPPVPSEEQVQAGDPSVKLDYRSFLSKKEAFYAQKLNKEKDLFEYEDEAEGWVWHVTKGDLRLRTSGMWWWAVVYPDSVPANWIERLKNLGFRIAISPLHDKDTWDRDSPAFVDPLTGEVIPEGAVHKKGDKKKAHWHVIIVTDKRIGYQEINDTIRTICNCPYIQKCYSLRNAYDYFLHINAPHKYQGYDKSEIQTYNNFHVEPTKYEKTILMQEMLEMIDEHEIDTFTAAVDLFRGDPEMLLVLDHSQTLRSYISGKYRANHPHDVRYTQVKTVERFDFEKEDDYNG